MSPENKKWSLVISYQAQTRSQENRYVHFITRLSYRLNLCIDS